MDTRSLAARFGPAPRVAAGPRPARSPGGCRSQVDDETAKKVVDRELRRRGAAGAQDDGRVEGVRSFYVAAPACAASRASLLTGRQFVRALGDDGLRPEEVTIARMLKDAGYRTACFGKWHLGHPPPQSPLAHGFDEFVGFKTGAIDNYSHFYYWGGPHRHVLMRGDQPYREDGVFFPDIVTREAIRFLDDNRERPFFLYLSFNMPHYPLQPEPRFLRRYRDLDDLARRYYAAFLTSMDDHLGRILGRLDELDLARDTVVLFLSDHGHSHEEQAFGGGGRSTPFRGGKGTLWEGGIRVPCILSAPGRLPEGQVRDQPATSMDVLPTVAALAGAAAPARVLDGRDLAPVLASASAPNPHDALFWAYEDLYAVRHADWKAVGDVGANTLALYDLRHDPGERRNVAGSHPEVVSYLLSRRDDWVRTLMATDPHVARQYGAASN